MLDVVIPFGPVREVEKGKGFFYKGIEYIHHAQLFYSEMAFFRVSHGQHLLIALNVFLLSVGFVTNWHITISIFVAVLMVLYFADLLFNLFLIFRSFFKAPEIKIPDYIVRQVPDTYWPQYTIFCPLYKEWKVLGQFIEAMQKLDYPKDRLQILLLLEEDDVLTIEQVGNYQLPSYFKVIIVPKSLPRTKPKALNYGLRYASGEYVVVYDAEDIPDEDQLKKVVIAFDKSDKKIKCIQAKLNFYNPHQNLLTRIFTAEYSLWFDLVLTGLQSIHAPIPLGGTSNHFRVRDLADLKGWDPFNVTEDCDLGMRLVKRGYNTAIVDSTTQEEANSSLSNWFWQRTRWIKGYIQTYLVHMRKPKEFIRDWKRPDIVTFQLVVGGKVLSMLINPIMWIITISYFLFRPVVGDFIDTFFPPVVLYMGVFSLVAGNFLYLYYYMIGCSKRGYNDIVKYVLFVPVYWLAMSVAACTAIYMLVRNPHFWSKTKHGLHLKRRSVPSASQIVDRAFTGFVPSIHSLIKPISFTDL